jgi:hypothetical protein
MVMLALSSCASDPASGNDDAGTTTDGSEPTGGDEGAEAVDEGESSIFIAPSDVPIDGGCDPWQQDCPDGEKCVPYASYYGSWNLNKCVAILGDGLPGALCISDGMVLATDTCGADSICWNAIEMGGQLVGQCAPLCGGDIDNPLCEPETACVLGNDGVLTLCGQTCLPVLDDCPEDLACTFMGLDFHCVVPQGAALGQPCAAHEECEAGAMCLWNQIVPGCEDSDCCAAFCDLVQPECTIPGTECVSFFEAGTVEPPYDQQGVCIDVGA